MGFRRVYDTEEITMSCDKCHAHVAHSERVEHESWHTWLDDLERTVDRMDINIEANRLLRGI